MFETYTHPESKEEYSFRLHEQLRPLDDRQGLIMEFCKETDIKYIYWNGWFYFRSMEDYTTIMLIF